MHQAIINKVLDKNTDHRDEEGHFYYQDLVGADAYNKAYDEISDKKISEISNSSLNDNTKYKKTTFNNLRHIFLNTFENGWKNKMPSLKKLKKEQAEKRKILLHRSQNDQSKCNANIMMQNIASA